VGFNLIWVTGVTPAAQLGWAIWRWECLRRYLLHTLCSLVTDLAPESQREFISLLTPYVGQLGISLVPSGGWAWINRELWQIISGWLSLECGRHNFDFALPQQNATYKHLPIDSRGSGVGDALATYDRRLSNQPDGELRQQGYDKTSQLPRPRSHRLIIFTNHHFNCFLAQLFQNLVITSFKQLASMNFQLADRGDRISR